MSTDRFDQAFAFTVGHEGGYSTDRRDRGNWTTGVVGKGTLKGTKYGISAMSYPDLDIKNLTLDQAKAIYRRDYWRRMKCDQLPPGLDLVVFDAGVNSGQYRSVCWLQQPLGVRIDGLVGPATLEACQAAWARDWEELLEDVIDNRWQFMQQAATFPIYKNGWRKRILEIGKEARQWARAGQLAQPAPSEPEWAEKSSEPVPADASRRVEDEIIHVRQMLAELQALVAQIFGTRDAPPTPPAS